MPVCQSGALHAAKMINEVILSLLSMACSTFLLSSWHGMASQLNQLGKPGPSSSAGRGLLPKGDATWPLGSSCFTSTR